MVFNFILVFKYIHIYILCHEKCFIYGNFMAMIYIKNRIMYMLSCYRAYCYNLSIWNIRSDFSMDIVQEVQYMIVSATRWCYGQLGYFKNRARIANEGIFVLSYQLTLTTAFSINIYLFWGMSPVRYVPFIIY